MPLYDGPYLLDLFNRMAGRATSDAITPETKYTWLAEAEREVITEIASIAPQVLYPKVGTASLPTMTTTDQNVFTFGSGDTVVTPFGQTQIYKNVSEVPDRPLVPGYDYIDEVSQIRLFNNRKYSGTLYYRGIIMPAAIAADEAPHLLPIAANELTAIRAVQNFAESGGLRNTALADRMRLRWRERFPYHCLVWKKQFRGGGALMLVTAKDLVTPLR